MQVFETEQEFLAEVQLLVTPGDAIPDLATALRDGVQGAERESMGANSAPDGLNLQMGNWVIRDRDLPVLETIGLVGAGIAVLVGSGGILAGAAVAGFTSFAKMVWATWRKTTRLSPDEIAVLGILKMRGPKSAEDLVEETIKIRPDMTENEVAAALTSLTDVEQLDGDIIELVRKDASGRWRVRDV
jgi:hypothetical protein